MNPVGLLQTTRLSWAEIFGGGRVLIVSVDRFEGYVHEEIRRHVIRKYMKKTDDCVKKTFCRGGG